MINRSIVIVIYFLCTSLLSYALFERDKAAYAGQQQEWQKAHELLMPLVVDNIDDFFLLYDTGVTSYKTEDYEHAQGYFDAVIHAQSVGDQLKEQALFNAGNTAVKRKMLEDAIAYYEQALAIAPDNERTKHNLDIAKKMRDEQKQQEQQEKNKEQEQQDQKKNDKQQDQQAKEQHDQQQQDSSGDEQQDKQQQEQDSQNSADSNQQKNEQQGQKECQSKSDDKEQSKQQQSDQDKDQRGNPQDRQNNEKKQQKQKQREKDLERNLQDKPSNEHKDQNEHKNFNQNEKDHTKNIATTDSEQDTAKLAKEQEGAAAGVGQRGLQKMAAVERPDALDTVDEWLATILKKCEQDDAELSKYMIKAAVGEQLAGQDGQNCW